LLLKKRKREAVREPTLRKALGAHSKKVATICSLAGSPHQNPAMLAP
jgi:hypothetical protein